MSQLPEVGLSQPHIAELWDALTLPTSSTNSPETTFQDPKAILQSILQYSADASHVYRGKLHVDMGRYSATKCRAIHVVALSGREDVMSELLKVNRIDVNVRDGKGVAALHMSVIRNFPGIARLLLNAEGIRATAAISKSDPDKKFYETKGLNALHLAVLHDYPGMVQVLMNYSDEEMAAYNDGTELDEGAAASSRPSLRHELETLSPDDRLTPLQMALFIRREHYYESCERDDTRVEMVKALLEVGCDPLASLEQTSEGKPRQPVSVHGTKYYPDNCLQVAICKGYEKCAKYMLDYTIDITPDDLGGPNILHAIVANGMASLIPNAVAAGCDVNGIDDAGYSVLHNVLRYCEPSKMKDVIKCLFDFGAKPRATRRGALVRPILNVRPVERHLDVPFDVLKLLVEHGADPSKVGEATRPYVKNSIQTSFFLYNIDYCQLLIDNGCDLDVKDHCGMSLFAGAVYRGDVEKALLLLESGCDPTLPHYVRKDLFQSENFAPYTSYILRCIEIRNQK